MIRFWTNLSKRPLKSLRNVYFTGIKTATQFGPLRVNEDEKKDLKSVAEALSLNVRPLRVVEDERKDPKSESKVINVETLRVDENENKDSKSEDKDSESENKDSESENEASKEKPLLAGDYEMLDPKSEDEVVNVVFIDRYKERHEIRGKLGDKALFLAKRYGVELEGSCGGATSCSTCHVFVEEKFYNLTLEQSPKPDKEDDMLDMAPLLRENSRLGCQLILTKDMEGMELEIPRMSRNFYVDGHVPTSH